MKNLSKIINISFNIFLAALSIWPVAAFADISGGNGSYSLQWLIGQFLSIINLVIPFIIALTLLVFLWGIFQYVLSNDESSQKEAKNFIIYGIISLFVMVSVWGLVKVLNSTFFGNNFFIPQLR